MKLPRSLSRRSRRTRGDHAAPRFGGRAFAGDAIKVIRWPAILLLAAALASMVALDTSDDEADSATGPVERTIAAVVGSPDSLASTWYCSAGSIVEGGVGDHVVILANPSDLDALISMTIVPVLAPQPITLDLGTGDADGDGGAPTTDDLADTVGQAPQAVVLDTVRHPAVVQPHSVQRIRLADVEGVGGEFAAVLVESDLGDLVVEHELTGPTGSSTAPCASSSSKEWFFAAGTTRKGVREYLSIYNPFPGDAVVDITLAVDGVLRSPRAYDGLVVPSGAVVPVDLSAVVTLFDSVAAKVSARTGRVVVDRLVSADGTEGPVGLSVAPGAASAAATWVLPGGLASGPTAIAIYNPSPTDDAIVDVELRPEAALSVIVEPIGVTVRPGRTELVVVADGAEMITTGRVVDASGRLAGDAPFWLAVRRLSGADVVVERLVIADTTSASSTAAAPATSVAATTHMFTSGTGIGGFAVAHPARDRLALIEITVAAGGELFSIAPIELGASDRRILDFESLGIPPNALVMVETSEPVYVERRIETQSGWAWSPVLPQVTSLVELEIPFG